MAARKNPAKKAPARTAPSKATASAAPRPPSKKAISKKAPSKEAPSKEGSSTRAGRTRPAPKASSRARGVTVQVYLDGLAPEQAVIARRLDAIATAEVGAPGTIKWGQPVWEAGGPVAYLRGASRHVTFGLWRGAELSDPAGQLVGDGTRMRHLRIASLADLDEALVRRLLREAVALNARHGDPTRAK